MAKEDRKEIIGYIKITVTAAALGLIIILGYAAFCFIYIVKGR